MSGLVRIWFHLLMISLGCITEGVSVDSVEVNVWIIVLGML